MNLKITEDSTNSRWQQRSLERSIGSVRTRSLARSSKFLAAAMNLLIETGDIDFTVQNVVERSQLSLRSFYQHFDGKRDLLLALYEELISQFVDDLREEVESLAEPLDRLERYCKAYLVRAEESRAVGGRSLSIYQLGLVINHPEDYSRTFEPQLVLLRELVEEAARSRAIESELSSEQIALLLNTTLMSVAQMRVFGTGDASAECSADEVWEWCLGAVRGRQPENS
jgi:AcrR family transcriptional regulator